MMSPENIQANPPPRATREESQSSGGRKTAPARPPDQATNCPRCDSPNTKFCYYNNYSLTQPRHFCKTCRRYWTKGGALRNVPIGGGCRKNKKMKSSSSSRLSSGGGDSGGSSDIGSGGGLNLKFFQGISPPAMDFQLGSSLSSFPRLQLHSPSLAASGYNYNYNQFSQFGDISTSSTTNTTTPCFGNIESLGNSNNTISGINFPFSSVLKQGGETSSGGFGLNIHQEMGGSMNVHSNIANSIESLSSINQDLHWKLQQQRLAALFGGEMSRKDQDQVIVGGRGVGEINCMESLAQKPQPIVFQNLEMSRVVGEACGEVGGGNSRKECESSTTGNNNNDNNHVVTTEWFFDNSYAAPTNNSVGNGNDQSTSNWNGIQGWTDLNQYSALP